VAEPILPPLRHDPDGLRDAAADLLSRPPFVDEQPGPVGRLLARAGDAIAELLGRLLSLMGGGSALGWVIVVVALAVLAVVAWRVSRGATLDRQVPQAGPGQAAHRAVDWDRDADVAMARGELREAVRCRYAAIVATLIEAGIVEESPGRTVRELDAEVRAAAPFLAAEVAAAGERFDRIWYGGMAAEPEDDRALRGVRHGLLEALAVAR
jgi:hypothetical protein